MKHALDLAVIWIYCLVSAVFIPVDIPFVSASLAAVVYGCGSSLARSGGVRLVMTLLFLSVSVMCPQFLIYVPLAVYTLLSVAWSDTHDYVAGVIACCLGAALYVSPDRALVCFAAVGCVIAGMLQYQTGRYDLLDARYRRTRDDSVEKNLLLREKNQSILEKQDYEIYTATLKERNRIAREIHDNVGHMLSRSILMVGAMKAVHGEGSLKEPLHQLEDTLNAAMTSIRESVHDLHDEAVNLKEVLESLTGEYTFCQARLVYDMGYEVPREIRYGFIAIVKEALNNVMKHSNATWVQVVAREHPGMYQLIIEDNGTSGNGRHEEKPYAAGIQEQDKGIGIRNMKERVDAFGGNLEIQTQKGWRIHITVPKKTDERGWLYEDCDCR